MKKNSIVLSILLVSLFVFVGCATTKDVDNNLSISAKKSVVVDWSNRTIGLDSVPEWLPKLLNGNTKIFKSEFGIDNSYIIKYGIASSKTKDASLAASRVNYNAMRAEELRTQVASIAETKLNSEGETDVVANAALNAKVDLSGHELVTQFWQEVVTYNEEDSSEKTEFICYSIYKISKSDWTETLKKFMASIIPAIQDPEAQKIVAASAADILVQTTSDVEKTSAETLAEINAKLDAIETGTKTPSYPAPNSNDVDWLKVLETACNVIF